MSISFDDVDRAAQDDVRRLREEIAEADRGTICLLLTGAHSHNAWQDRDVPEETLRAIYDVMKWGRRSPTGKP